MPRRYVFLVFLVMVALQGCGSGNSDQIIALQKQITLLSRQLEEMRKDIDALREGDKSAKQSLDALEAEVNRLKALEVLPPGAAKAKTEIITPADRAPESAPRSPQAQAAPKKTTRAGCAQVWELLGKGNDETVVARTLGITPEQVRACEQGVGRGKVR